MSKEHEQDKREKEKREVEAGDAGWDELLEERDKTHKKNNVIGW